MNQSKRNGKACYYCRRQFNDKIKKTKDHIIASSRGGLNVSDNFADCCDNCNQWKADKPLEKWLDQVLGYLRRKRHPVYTVSELGQIVGNIKKLISQLHNNRTVSIYKIK